MLWFALACRAPGTLPPVTTPTTIDTEDPPPVPTTTTDPTSPPPPDPCEVDAALSITSVTTEQPWHENEVQVDVALSSDAAVAVQCTLDGDPAEVHLAESTTPASAHEVRISGLLADSTYSCLAAAVCPATSAPTAFTVTTGGPPPGLPEVRINEPGDHGSEYVLVNETDDCSDFFQRVVVRDRDGRVRWWYRTADGGGKSIDFRFHGDDQFAWGGGWSPNSLARPRKVDLFDGEVYDSAAAMSDYTSSSYHHDGKQLPDGRMLTLEQVRIENGNSDFDGFRVRRVDPVTNTVDFDYHSQSAFDDGDLPAGSGDAWHANWVDIVDETLYVSLCFMSRVLAIDVATGELKWQFGPGLDWELEDANGDALSDQEFTDCEHGLQVKSDGTMFVYDNGGHRGARSYSRASAYHLDESTMVATMEWTWTEPNWFESTLGSIDELPSGNVLIDAAHAECFSSNPGDRTTVLEVDPVAGEKVWEMKYTDVQSSGYRADFADPCALFGNAQYCASVAERVTALAGVFGG